MIASSAALFLASLSWAPASDKCDLPGTASAPDVIHMLSRRAVDAVERARRAGWKGDATLAAIVAPSARFDLGSGDVGRPLGAGVEGLRAMALAMQADRFRFKGWNGIPMQAEPCKEWKMDVEFIDSKTNSSSLVTFSFLDGHIVGAAGWQIWFETGPLAPVER